MVDYGNYDWDNWEDNWGSGYEGLGYDYQGQGYDPTYGISQPYSGANGDWATEWNQFYNDYPNMQENVSRPMQNPILKALGQVVPITEPFRAGLDALVGDVTTQIPIDGYSPIDMAKGWTPEGGGPAQGGTGDFGVDMGMGGQPTSGGQFDFNEPGLGSDYNQSGGDFGIDMGMGGQPTGATPPISGAERPGAPGSPDLPTYTGTGEGGMINGTPQEQFEYLLNQNYNQNQGLVDDMYSQAGNVMSGDWDPTQNPMWRNMKGMAEDQYATNAREIRASNPVGGGLFENLASNMADRGKTITAGTAGIYGDQMNKAWNLGNQSMTRNQGGYQSQAQMELQQRLGEMGINLGQNQLDQERNIQEDIWWQDMIGQFGENIGGIDWDEIFGNTSSSTGDGDAGEGGLDWLV